MYVKNGIAYAGEAPKLLEVVKIKFIGDYKIDVLFSNSKEKIIDFKPLLKYPCYKKLNDIDIFKAGYIDGGVLTWSGGETDITADWLNELN